MRRLMRVVAVGSVAVALLASCGGSSKSAAQKSAEAANKILNDAKKGNTKDLQKLAQQANNSDTNLGDPCKLVKQSDIEDIFGGTITKKPTTNECKYHLEGTTKLGDAGIVGADVLVRYSHSSGKVGFDNLKAAFKAASIDGVGDDAFIQDIGGAVVTFVKGNKIVDVQSVFVASNAPKDQVRAATIELAKRVAGRV
jgi:hypothetical protein